MHVMASPVFDSMMSCHVTVSLCHVMFLMRCDMSYHTQPFLECIRAFIDTLHAAAFTTEKREETEVEEEEEEEGEDTIFQNQSERLAWHVRHDGLVACSLHV